jgi:LuxR family transcriptional regulator, maltose regulon positive regulatory protein
LRPAHYPHHDSGVVEVSGELESGRAAMLRGAWAEARRGFEAALAAGKTIEALEGLGAAARWAMDGPAALDAHERAYRLAREARDDEASGRLALELTWDCFQFRGAAEANGWLERAGRLLERQPPSAARAIQAYLRASRALHADHDPARAAEIAAEGAQIAREARAFDEEMACVALEGLSLVAAGDVGEGMRRLDEATAAAVAGEVAFLRIVETICCHLIDACQRVRDLERAEEWCRRVEELSQRHDDVEMFATCRKHYAELLVWRGDWRNAETMLTTACRDLGGVPRKVAEVLVRLADLRRRQGDPKQAEALLAEAGETRGALLVHAALALDRGDATAACDAAQRFLRMVGEADRFERIAGLELLVRALAELDESENAAMAVAELEELAAEVGTAPLRASALLARGRLERSAELLEDAAMLYGECGASYDAAHARLELGRILREEGRVAQAEQAEETARHALRELGSPAPEPEPESRLLTPREQEVLRLLARGTSNATIAEKLVLSVRTVERHVENIYAKIGVSGRTARAAATAWAFSHGLG